MTFTAYFSLRFLQRQRKRSFPLEDIHSGPPKSEEFPWTGMKHVWQLRGWERIHFYMDDEDRHQCHRAVQYVREINILNINCTRVTLRGLKVNNKKAREWECDN